MKNLSIGKKLSLTFGLIMLLYAGALFIALFIGMQTVGTSFSGFYNGPHAVIGTATDLRHSVEMIEKDLLKMATASTPAEIPEYQEDMEAASADAGTYIEFLKNNLTAQENTEKIEQILLKQEALKTARQAIQGVISDGDTEKALTLYKTEYAPLANEIRNLAVSISDSAKTMGEDYYSDAQSSEKGVTLGILLYFLISMGILILLCAYIIRSITRPVREMEAVAKLLTEGNLGVEVQYESKDEIGSLAASISLFISKLRRYIMEIESILGRMAEGDLTATTALEYQNDFAPIKLSIEKIVTSLNDTLSQISASSQQVAAGSEQISSGAQDLAQGATEQATSSEELAASITEISKKVQENALHSKQVSITMGETIQTIQQGDAQMRRLVTAMNEMADTSGEIGKIIKTIEDIAFQTNVLSLNAAVEAARAGTAGKGFAVVADEVRNLAGKSAIAAKNTTALIQSTITAIKSGSNMVSETEKTLAQIFEKAENVAALVEEIAEASTYQASAISEINIGMNQISGVIQTNSATAEESAAASEELSAQAVTLQALVSHFKIQIDAPDYDNNQTAEGKYL